MKSLRRTALITGFITSLHFDASLAFAASTQSAQMDALQALIQAVQTTTPLPASELPVCGSFYSAQFGTKWPPLPSNPLNLLCWQLGDGLFVMDDRNVDYAELEAEAEAAALLSAPLDGGLSIMASTVLNSYIAYGNPVYLTNM